MFSKNKSSNYFPDSFQNQIITELELSLLLLNPITVKQLFNLITGIKLTFRTHPIFENENPALRYLSIWERANLENSRDLEAAIVFSCTSQSGNILGEHGKVSLIYRDANSWCQSIDKAWNSHDLQAAGIELIFPFDKLQLSPEIHTFTDLSKIANFNILLPAQWDKGNVYRFNLFLITPNGGFSLDLRDLEYAQVSDNDKEYFEANLSGIDLQKKIIKNQFINREIKELINIFNNLDI
jgi:hypothetical protein